MYLASGPHPLSRGIVQERAPLSPVIRSTSGAESRETHLIINGFLSRCSAIKQLGSPDEAHVDDDGQNGISCQARLGWFQ